MQSKDITKGQTYAYARFGSLTGRRPAAPGDRDLVRATVVGEPERGEVLCMVEDRDGTESIPVRRLLVTWAEHEAILTDRVDRRRRSIAEQEKADERIRALIGEPLMTRLGVYVEFRVHGDGSYSTSVRSMPRTALVDLLEAAYEAGRREGGQ